MTRKGAPQGAYAAADQDDSREDTAIEEVTHRVRAALRLLTHATASGELPITDLVEAVIRLLAIADDALATVGARDAV